MGERLSQGGPHLGDAVPQQGVLGDNGCVRGITDHAPSLPDTSRLNRFGTSCPAVGACSGALHGAAQPLDRRARLRRLGHVHFAVALRCLQQQRTSLAAAVQMLGEQAAERKLRCGHFLS